MSKAPNPHEHWLRRDLLAGSLAALGGVTGCAALGGDSNAGPPAAPGAFTKMEVAFGNGDIRLAGDLYLPEGPVRAPCVVFGHGSGRVARPNPRFTFEAEGLAARGFACLVFDKRGCGQSTGDWRTSNFHDLASDMRVALAFARAHLRVDARRVGYRGASQAGYVLPIAAVESPAPSFVILISAPMVTIAEQIAYEGETRLRAANLSPEDFASAIALSRQALEVARTGEGAQAYFARVREVADTPWYQASPTPPESESWFFDWMRPIHGFEPGPYFARMSMPLLAYFGEADTLVPADVARRRLEALYQGRRHRLLTVVAYANAGHDLRYPDAGGQQRILAPDYLDRMASWIYAAL